MAITIEPFLIDVPDSDLVDLRERLARTRLPEQLPDAEWDYGTERGYLAELVEYWRDRYDWRRAEKRLNTFAHYLAEIDGTRVHFVHAPSPEPDALPIIITHGWPGSIVEFLDIIEPLRDPVAHGGEAADAFNVVCPSIPGYAFSGPTGERGWGPRRIAGAWAQLMAGLGYERYGAQGGDWGSMISAQLGLVDPDHLAGIHLNMVVAPPPADVDLSNLTPSEQAALASFDRYQRIDSGYAKIQSTKPQTIGYALDDSPAGLAAWIVEKFRTWSDCEGDVETRFTKDQLLDNVMLYWLTRTAHSAARLYYEAEHSNGYVPDTRVEVPTGFAVFPKEIIQSPRHWAERRFNVVHWSDMPRGGHFAAFEEGGLLVDDIRTFFRPLR
jgi:pimeloyl-ACP methyl ester carboxylesterase